MAEKFNKLKTKQTIELSDKLRKVCHLNSNTDYAEYNEGWSDQRIVAESNGEYTLANVSGIRQETIGHLKPVRGPGRINTMGVLSSLDERLERLETWARSRPVQPFGKPVPLK